MLTRSAALLGSSQMLEWMHLCESPAVSLSPHLPRVSSRDSQWDCTAPEGLGSLPRDFFLSSRGHFSLSVQIPRAHACLSWEWQCCLRVRWEDFRAGLQLLCRGATPWAPLVNPLQTEQASVACCPSPCHSHPLPPGSARVFWPGFSKPVWSSGLRVAATQTTHC